MNSNMLKITFVTTLTVAAGVLGAGTARAASLVLDFEQFGVTNLNGPVGSGSQNLNGREVAVGGVGITLSAFDTNPLGLPLTTFDSSCPGGATGTGPADNDLCQTGFNNVLIINEDFDLSDPDDDASRPAGTIGFDFSQNVFLESITLIDTEETGTVRAFLGGNLLQANSFSGIGDGEFQVIDLSGFGEADRLEVALGGSGALDNLQFSPGGAVPEPATMLGLACGGGAMLAARKRRRPR